jgi:hypothetical protein
MLTPEEQQQVSAIKARLSAIPPGPWEWGVAESGHYIIASDDSMNDVAIAGLEDDAEFITEAPEDIATLLAIVKRLKAGNDILAKKLFATIPSAGMEIMASQEQRIIDLESALADMREQRDHLASVAASLAHPNPIMRTDLERWSDTQKMIDSAQKVAKSRATK